MMQVTATTTNRLLRVLAVLVAMAAAVLVAVIAGYGSASAQTSTTITVNTDQDEITPNDQKCSLREAIQNANDNTNTYPDCAAGSGADTIVFDPSLKGKTITLSSTLPTITDSAGLTIDGQNNAITVSGGGRVQVFYVNGGAKLALNNLTVASGYGVGGGIFNASGTLTVTNSTFSGNSAFDSAGGIYNDIGGTLTVTNSTFSGNSAPYGGGIYNQGGTLTVTNSTFSGNSAHGGGGSGGGIYNNFGGTVTFTNTIVAKSTSGGNCGGDPITDGGYNLDDGTTCGFSTTNHSKPSTDPQFAGGLADNGGPTQTIALSPTSPAVNAIPFATNGCGTDIKTDQRGVKRPQGTACDIGAYELAQSIPGGGGHHHKKKHHH